MELKFPWHSSISWHPFNSWYSILNKIHLILELNNSQQHLFGSWVQFSTTLIGFLSWTILNNTCLVLEFNSQQHLLDSWVQFSTTLVWFLSSILNNTCWILEFNSQQQLLDSWVQFSTTLVWFLSSILNNTCWILEFNSQQRLFDSQELSSLEWVHLNEVQSLERNKNLNKFKSFCAQCHNVVSALQTQSL
jgi:hypothetical protein